MATSYIDIFSFEFWRSDPPRTVSYQGESFIRPGVDGVGKVRTGKRGTQFKVVVEEDLISAAAARALLPRYGMLPFAGPVRVIWEGVDYFTTFNHLYLIDDVQVMQIKTTPRLAGPNYDFLGGARITVHWVMTPYYIDPLIDEEN